MGMNRGNTLPISTCTVSLLGTWHMLNSHPLGSSSSSMPVGCTHQGKILMHSNKGTGHRLLLTASLNSTLQFRCPNSRLWGIPVCILDSIRVVFLLALSMGVPTSRCTIKPRYDWHQRLYSHLYRKLSSEMVEQQAIACLSVYTGQSLCCPSAWGLQYSRCTLSPRSDSL